MKPLLFLSLFLMSVITAYGQRGYNQFFTAGGSYIIPSPNYTFIQDKRFESHKDFKSGFVSNGMFANWNTLYHGNLTFGVSIEYRYTEVRYDINPDIRFYDIDPYLGFHEQTYPLFFSVRNEAFTSISLGWMTKVNKGYKPILFLELPFEIGIGLSFASYDLALLTDSSAVKLNRFQRNNFTDGISYSISFSPALQWFPWSQGRAKNFGFKIGARAGVSVYNGSDITHHHSYGGTIGLIYRLQK